MGLASEPKPSTSSATYRPLVTAVRLPFSGVKFSTVSAWLMMSKLRPRARDRRVRVSGSKWPTSLPVGRRAPLAMARSLPASREKRVTSKSASPKGEFLSVSASARYIRGGAIVASFLPYLY